MNDLEQRLRGLADAVPASSPRPDRVQRRATQLRRRRYISSTASAASVVVVAAFFAPAVINMLPPGQGVVLSPGEPPPVPPGWTRHVGVRATLDYPEDWLVLTSPTARQTEDIVSTHVLTEEDRNLARLVTSEVRFSPAFPRDAVVFVVGGDPAVAPPEPAGALGPASTLPQPDGFTAPISVRRGRIGRSIHHITAYIGPDANADDIGALDAIAASARPHEPSPNDRSDTPPPPDFVPLDDATATEFADRVSPTGLRVALDEDEAVALHVGDGCVGLLHEITDVASSSWLQPMCKTTTASARDLLVRHDTAVVLKSVGKLNDVMDVRVMVLQLSLAYDAVAVQLADGQVVRGVSTDGYGLVTYRGRAAYVLAYQGDQERARVPAP